MNTENKRKKGLAQFLIRHPILSAVSGFFSFIFLIVLLPYFFPALPFELIAWVITLLYLFLTATYALAQVNYCMERDSSDALNKELFKHMLVCWRVKNLGYKERLHFIALMLIQYSQKKRKHRKAWKGSLKTLLDWRIWVEKDNQTHPSKAS